MSNSARSKNRNTGMPSDNRITITVGARRSCVFTPAAIERDRDGNADPRQLDLMSRVDRAVYHSPLDSAPARKRKAGPVLGASLKAGERAMEAPDHKDCKRAVGVAIYYRTEGAGDDGRCWAWAIFGGMTPTAAQACVAEVSRNGKGHAHVISDADITAAMKSGLFRGERVAWWPSEMMRQGVQIERDDRAEWGVSDHVTYPGEEMFSHAA